MPGRGTASQGGKGGCVSLLLVTKRVVALACTYAFVGWAVFSVLLVALGNVLLPEITRPATPAVVVALAGLTAVAVAALSLDYFRRVSSSDLTTALTLGVALASIGLGLDAALLLATQFRYPNVEAHRTPTLVVALLLGYAVAAVIPVEVALLRRAR